MRVLVLREVLRYLGLLLNRHGEARPLSLHSEKAMPRVVEGPLRREKWVLLS